MTAIISRLSTALTDRYRLERQLGEGGMATVYLSHDIRHDRPVALKVLKPELAAVIGAERFLNEITVTANLQHPNILALYDSGEAESFLYYVMPYVEGESLRDKLNREKQLAIEETVHITQSVAAALDYAHRHHVIHRDIKPENILLHDGQPLIADFGIALAVTQAGGTRLTETGLSVGTPHYMSPEQAMGDRELDGRSDVYSLGCVTYEMLAGEPPHTGPTAQAVLAKIVTERAAPVSEARPTTPAAVSTAVAKALEKLPADRFRSAAEFSTALTNPTATTGSLASPRSLRAGNRVALAATVALLTGLAAFALGRFAFPTADAADRPVARFTLDTGGKNFIGNSLARYIAISRDGQTVAYVVQDPPSRSIWVRRLSSFDAMRIADSWEAGSPAISPDGQWLAFQTLTGEVRLVSRSGGAPETVATGGEWSLSWTAEGEILLGGVKGVRMISPDGGDARQLTVVDTTAGETAHWSPRLLPGGDHLLLALQRSPYNGGIALAVISLETKERIILEPGGIQGARYANGHVVWVQLDGTLRAAPFDAYAMRFTGPAKTIARDVGGTGGGVSFPQFDVSDNGDLVYVPALPRQLVLVDRSGRATPLTNDTRVFHHPRFSPDGRRIVMDITQKDGRDVWVLDTDNETLVRITNDGDANDPIWTPDGRRIAFASPRTGTRGIYLTNADGTVDPESLLVTANGRTAGAWLPDGTHLLTIPEAPRGWGMDVVPLDGDRQPVPLSAPRFQEGWPSLSPDGRWLAYVSNQSGRDEVYMRSMSGAAGRVLISRSGGSAPVWAKNGRELFYRDLAEGRERLVAVAVETAPRLRVVSRTPLFDLADYESAAPHANYDVHPDGEHFVMVRAEGGDAIMYVQNWVREMEPEHSAR